MPNYTYSMNSDIFISYYEGAHITNVQLFSWKAYMLWFFTLF